MYVTPRPTPPPTPTRHSPRTTTWSPGVGRGGGRRSLVYVLGGRENEVQTEGTLWTEKGKSLTIWKFHDNILG